MASIPFSGEFKSQAAKPVEEDIVSLIKELTPENKSNELIQKSNEILSHFPLPSEHPETSNILEDLEKKANLLLYLIKKLSKNRFIVANIGILEKTIIKLHADRKRLINAQPLLNVIENYFEGKPKPRNLNDELELIYKKRKRKQTIPETSIWKVLIAFIQSQIDVLNTPEMIPLSEKRSRVHQSQINIKRSLKQKRAEATDEPPAKKHCPENKSQPLELNSQFETVQKNVDLAQQTKSYSEQILGMLLFSDNPFDILGDPEILRMKGLFAQCYGEDYLRSLALSFKNREIATEAASSPVSTSSGSGAGSAASMSLAGGAGAAASMSLTGPGSSAMFALQQPAQQQGFAAPTGLGLLPQYQGPGKR